MNAQAFKKSYSIDIILRPNTFLVTRDGATIAIRNTCPINSIIHGAFKLNAETNFLESKEGGIFETKFLSLLKTIIHKSELEANKKFYEFIIQELTSAVLIDKNGIDCETSIFSVIKRIIRKNIETKCLVCSTNNRIR